MTHYGMTYSGVGETCAIKTNYKMKSYFSRTFPEFLKAAAIMNCASWTYSSTTEKDSGSPYAKIRWVNGHTLICA